MRKLAGLFLFLCCVAPPTGCSIRQDVRPVAPGPEAGSKAAPATAQPAAGT